MTEEVRTVDPDTGAEKGAKLARHSLIPGQALTEIAEHYGRGSEKYADHNWRKGYAWSLSYDALVRHLTAFWDGEDYDEELGNKHIIAVAWHAIALATFMDEHPEKDDRYLEHRSIPSDANTYISYDDVLEIADAWANSTVVCTRPDGSGFLLTKNSDKVKVVDGMSFDAHRTDNA
jgi:hypothetical protein